MKKRRLTQAMRRDIAGALCEDKYTPLLNEKYKELADIENSISLLVYPQDMRDAVQEFEDRFPDHKMFARRCSIGITISGHWGSCNLPSTIPMPDCFTDERVFIEHADLGYTWQNVKSDLEDLRAASRKLNKEVLNALQSFGTVETLVEGWPEAADTVKRVVGEPAAPVYLPAAVLQDLNTDLGLPKENTDASY